MGELVGSVAEIVRQRLADERVPEPVARLIRDALPGGEGAGTEAGQGGGAAASGPGRVYLKSVSARGFRGIGPEVTLHLQAGPGLTVVTGRNGSGKSSFAEAAEIALTGDNMRWANRNAVWKEGWRNLHAPDQPTVIEVKLTEDGQPLPTVVTRAWAPGGGLDDATATVAVAGAERPLAAKGWRRPLELYRPFLSYAELGALVGGTPSSMHDALQAILGLDALIDAERVLGDARRAADSASKRARQQLPALLAKLAEHPDERARAAERALGGRTWDLAALDALAVGNGAASDGRTGLLQQVLGITLPDTGSVAAAVRRVLDACAALAALEGTRSDDARRLANLLWAALDHQRSHAGEACPVCGGRALDDGWAAGAKESVRQLEEQAAEFDAARSEAGTAMRSLSRLVAGKPTVLGADLGEVAGAAAGAARAWDTLTGTISAETWWIADAEAASDPAKALASRTADLGAWADRVTTAFKVLADAVAGLRAAAGSALRERAEAWQPVAGELAGWVRVARESNAASVRLNDLKNALDWLRTVGREVRNARLAPFAATSASVWEALRQESNVELGPITLAGAGTQRKVTLDVTIDGVPGAALSVMSQGELHALGLALFLPRATAADSPFGFVVIDDPVQAMDPAKVDGLARVLSSVALTRQVVVFTHDDRLPAALRQLQLPATVLAVTRRERSVVSVRKVTDPVSRYLDDARAMALTAQLSEQIRAVAVAGLCRAAVEAACVDAVRARKLGQGVPHESVERQLEQASHSVQDMVALALFGSSSRGGEVVGRLRELGGEGFVRAFRDAKSGVHNPVNGDLKQLVSDTERLTKALRP